MEGDLLTDLSSERQRLQHNEELFLLRPVMMSNPSPPEAAILPPLPSLLLERRKARLMSKPTPAA